MTAIPAKHAHWLHLVNCRAGDKLSCPHTLVDRLAQGMRDSFYALKDRLLTAHGIPDGWDLQVIHDKCHGCGGTGIYDGGWTQDECYRCHGTGVYRTRRVLLRRYRFGGRLFHTPETVEPEALETLIAAIPPREQISGLIQHGPVDSWAAIRCYCRLLAAYEPTRLYDRCCAFHTSGRGWTNLRPGLSIAVKHYWRLYRRAGLALDPVSVHLHR